MVDHRGLWAYRTRHRCPDVGTLGGGHRRADRAPVRGRASERSPPPRSLTAPNNRQLWRQARERRGLLDFGQPRRSASKAISPYLPTGAPVSDPSTEFDLAVATGRRSHWAVCRGRSAREERFRRFRQSQRCGRPGRLRRLEPWGVEVAAVPVAAVMSRVWTVSSKVRVASHAESCIPPAALWTSCSPSAPLSLIATSLTKARTANAGSTPSASAWVLALAVAAATAAAYTDGSKVRPMA